MKRKKDKDLSKLIPKKKKKVIEQQKRREALGKRKLIIAQKIIDTIDINKVKKYKFVLTLLEIDHTCIETIIKIDEIYN